jgi:hypothetical protein
MPLSDFDPKVAEALPILLSSVAHQATRQQIEAILRTPGVRLIAFDSGDYLFGLRGIMREDLPHYRLFVLGRLLEIRRMAAFSNEYSMADFPEDLVASRAWIESRFTELSMSTEEGMGWYAPARWKDLTPEQQASAKPRFIRDNVRYLPM